MKNIYLTGLCWLATAMFSPLYAQTSTTIYTPKGSAVAALVNQESSSAQLAQYNNDAATQFPNATRLADASAKYNCHAYAWHLSEGSTYKVWLDTPGDDAYWNDGSFIQVCNESDATKISYASDDHSAIRSAQSIPLGRYDSKWGGWPLLRHAPTYTPYNSTVRKYYASTKVNGPSYVCSASNSNFTAAAITGATYTWTKSSNIVLSGSGNTVSAKATSGASGTGWIQVTINSPCGGSVTTRRNISIGSFSSYQMTVSGQPDVCPGGLYQYSVNVPGGHQPGYTYTWTYPSGWVAYGQGSNSISLYVSGSASYGALNVSVNNDCGTVSTGITVYPSYSCGTGTYAVYPNPADEQLNIEQEFAAAVENNQLQVSSTEASPQQESFSIQLYNKEQKKVAEAVSKKGKIILDTSKLPAGTYFLHIHHQDAVLKKQVIIK